MVRKGNLAVFESSNISETEKVTPTKIGAMHYTSIPTCMNFLNRFHSIKFFDRKGNLAVFESSNISEIGEVMPTKIGVHALHINPYLHEFFESIPFD